MIKRIHNFLWMALAVSLMVFYTSDSFARENTSNQRQQNFSLSKTAIGEVESMVNIGNWGHWFWANGVSAYDPYADGSGGYYPRGTVGAIFRDGLVWGGIVNDPDPTKTKLRIGGNTYINGTQPGWHGSDPNDERARLYRIRSDWRTLSASAVLKDAGELFHVNIEAVTEALTSEVIENYKRDWKNWPVDLGAPYYDVDEDGTYNPVLDAEGYPVAGTLQLEDGTEIVGNDYPGLAGADQVLWFVINDGKANDLYGSPSIGLEVQSTAWAYNQPTSGLGQIVFKKYKIINKSGFRIDSMYVSQWSDPDVGDYGNDVTGCDTELSLMFAYNGIALDNQYSAFNMAPPAIGYDFFQGPMIYTGDPADTAVFDLKKVAEHVNLPMTSYGYFGSGTVWTDPTLEKYEGSLQWWNLLRGYAPTDDIINPTEFVHTIGDLADSTTKFPLNGDPVAQTGDYDGVKYQPGDRRMLQCTGPFEMENNDVQEVVVAVLGGLGGDRLSSVTDMKSTDRVAQEVYNSLFQVIPKPPAEPMLETVASVDRVTLDWGWNENAVMATEIPKIINYEFEGYNVYQLPSPSASILDDRTVRLATYDLVNEVRIIKSSVFVPEFGTVVDLPIQFGSDTGIKRYFVAYKDYITNLPFYRGSTYYYAVTAYNYDGDLVRDRALESAATVFQVTVQGENPGERWGSESGQDHSDFVEHSQGTAAASVEVMVVDPAEVTGDDYKVFFDKQHYYLDVDGVWKKTNYPDSVGGALFKPGDVSPSTVTGSALVSSVVGTIDMVFTLDLVAPGGAWVDGVMLDFPDDLEINGWLEPSGAYNSYGAGEGQNEVNTEGTLDPATNAITWGDDARSGFGAFEGTVYFNVNVPLFELPITVGFTVYDDGYDGTVVDATGTITIDEFGYQFKTVDHWNLLNVATGDTVLEDRTDLHTATPSAGPIADGLQIAVIGNYDKPIDFDDVIYTNLAGEEESATNYDQSGVSSYYWSGWAESGQSLIAWEQGTDDLIELIKDYEMRWTGEFDTTDVGGQIQLTVKEGTGSLAYFEGARGYTPLEHPFNPTGADAPFMVRVPFEVWNIDDNRQINFLIYDRVGNVTADTFQAFNPNGRMYANFINTEYSEDLATVEAGLDEMTWQLVFWEAPYVKGELLTFIYPNPIIPYNDEFIWSTEGLEATYNKNTEMADVEKLNVFPNPYYGGNPQETNRFNRFITFNHLPQKATIRIFNLAGAQVRKLEKTDDSQFFRWDLQNENGLPVASGVYIVHIEMPDLGKTKVLKAFIVQAQQILEYY